MKRRTIWALVAALLLTFGLLVGSCAGEEATTTTSAEEPASTESTAPSTTEAALDRPVKIGGTLPLSGPAAGDGQRFLDGRKLAVKTINAAGGVLGQQLELVVVDDGFEPAKVPSLYENLVRQDKLDVLLSSYGAPMTMPAMAVADKYDKLVLSGYSSSTGLMEQYGGKRFFTVAAQPKDKMYVNWFYRGLTDFLADFDSWNTKADVQKPTKIAVLNENQLWGIEQHDLWKPHAEQQGWEIVVDEFVEMNQMEFSSLISKIKSANPDVIMTEFFYFRSVPFVKQLKEQGVKADFVACSEAGTTADWADETKGAGAVGNNVITFDYLPAAYTGGGSEEFRADFKAEYGREPGFLEAAGYAEVQVLAQAIETAGSIETDALRDALLSGSFETVYTSAKFDSMGLNAEFNPVVGQWIDGRLESVYPKDAATAELVYPFAQ